MVAAAEIYSRCAISATTVPIAEAKVVTAQAADELLNIDDVDASFVMYMETPTRVSISARSMGKVNVQLIMERLGGGGHLNMAGAQVSDIDMNEARTQLLAAIDAYYEAMGGQLQQAPAEKLPEKAQVK